MKKILIISVSIILFVVGCSQTPIQFDPVSWSMFGQNTMHQRFVENCNITSNLSLSWEIKTGAAGESSPIIADGIVYFGSFGKKLHAVNLSTGKAKWIFETNGVIKSTAIDIESKKILVPVEPGVLNCISSETGESIWAVSINTTLAPPTILDKKIYIGCRNKYVYCFALDTGLELWRFKTEASVNSTISIGEDSVFFGSNDGNLYCLNKRGSLLWQFKTHGAIVSTTAIKDNRVFFGSYDKNFYCLDAKSGSLIWKHQVGAEIQSSPALSKEHVYFPANDGYFYCLNQSDGEERWVFDTGSWQPINNSPAVTGNLIFFGATDSNVYCINSQTGEKLWSHKTGDRIWSSPAIYDNHLLIGSNDGKLYCFKSNPVVEE